MAQLSAKSGRTIRTIVQWCFLLWVIGIGIRFGMFVNAAESGASVPVVSRPPGVEGFLPIGALTSLKYWLVSGKIHPIHPASLVIFLTVLLMSLLAKKSFCSWLCPVGTLSEGAHKLGRLLFGRNFSIWPWLDVVLRGVKYLLLLLFVKLILLDMPADTLSGFLDAPYWAVSDVKMLHFFTSMSITTVTVLAILTFLSLLYKNFWCRYLCPYGALLGLASIISPFKIRRDTSGCTGCRRCTAACPSGLAVHSSTAVSSPECTGCLTCVVHCPEHNILAMQPFFWKRPLPVLVFPAVVVLIFMVGIGVGMFSGHWHSSLSYADYQRLIPLEPYLSH
ncbi:4Fe-4S binding protein [Oryzomonas rubra]|uniref:4Fe-4S binding protein n=1 Tax=Oryzomonas rubra TaxID=2509454 RepID=A0A5A9X5P6_9BACT|nr:4Fe-4S binding protein [Oryzomonas rubra]KAA0888326.1 4Fe-4S binding protein [Oryzomonas rubra]